MRALMNVRKQKYPLTEALENSVINRNQMREIMDVFWIPSEIFKQTSDRIRSSSIDDPEPPSPPESQAIQDLNNECGIDISSLQKAIHILKEGIDGKVSEMRDIETELKQNEETMTRYNEAIQSFKSSIETLPINVNISGQDMFLESLNHSLIQNLSGSNIPEKLRRFQYLTTQIRVSWGILRSLQDFRPTDTGMPQCNICFTNTVKSVLVPCGHMFCEHCLANISHDNKCFTCRRRSNRIQKLFPN